MFKKLISRSATIVARKYFPARTSEAVQINTSAKVHAAAKALRSRKKKASEYAKDVVDVRGVTAYGGNGGDGCISYMQLFVNDRAGPDGGDGGHGGHVVFKASSNVNGLSHVQAAAKANHGEKGYGRDCCGANAGNTIVEVPVGTIVKNQYGRIVADLHSEGMMFVAARGGAGGRGNAFFATSLQPTPLICEYGAEGEINAYTLELSCIAHFGLLGMPNAGKSTLLQAITRANPKVAPYPFTTLKPHLGTVHYTDLEQIVVADLPGLIEGSHLNKGLGISFLRHTERCLGLLIVLDMSEPRPWDSLNVLRSEVIAFSEELRYRPQIIVANKMDLPDAEENLLRLAEKCDKREKILPISAKIGKNLAELLSQLRIMYDAQISRREAQLKEDKKSAAATA